MGDRCGDNRFDIIKKAKAELLKSTNIETSEDEMKVLDNFLFRCWQMGWLERYEKPREPLDIPTMTTDFVKEHGLPCPNGYIFKDENGNTINAQKIVLEKKKNNISLTQEQINIMVHESCALFCKHRGCGVPRDTCTSLGTCDEHDEYKKYIRLYLMEK